MRCDWEDPEEPPAVAEQVQKIRAARAYRGRRTVDGLKGRALTFYARTEVELWLRRRAERAGASLSATVNALVMERVKAEQAQQDGREWD